MHDDELLLTKREFLIVKLLSESSDRAFSLEEIYARAYPLSSNTLHRSIAEYVYQIRSKFRPYGLNPIRTIWGGGYQWRKDAASSN